MNLRHPIHVDIEIASTNGNTGESTALVDSPEAALMAQVALLKLRLFRIYRSQVDFPAADRLPVVVRLYTSDTEQVALAEQMRRLRSVLEAWHFILLCEIRLTVQAGLTSSIHRFTIPRTFETQLSSSFNGKSPIAVDSVIQTRSTQGKAVNAETTQCRDNRSRSGESNVNPT